MILDVFKYYAQFPKLEGVKEIFANGKSEYPLYTQLEDYIDNMSSHSLIPEIDGYVFGQSYDDVKAQIGKLTGSYLFVDFGSFTSNRDQRNSIQETFELAVTIASKIPDASDLVEIAIITDQLLQLTNKLRAFQINDQAKHSWLKELSNKHNIIPFVAPEFSSIGWTVVLSREGADLLDVKELASNLKNNG
ncbi:MULTISPECIES: hypothetical protein [unclassified Bacteroides]|jgi:hypothetical protein|uniref:hypothetical protein n=1 Tax=unclassified Bacteroides TaxID=2646097 RepID=UPI000E8BDC9E|nr:MULTISPECIES: hypothetical protein [unclassified Bacteroides]RGN43819.1 hypothetical protein DXB63_15290 [Bacteroides sp. OM05-12]RHR73832.1 hypothetical protein DWW69_14305 [Bacteroides sp. AF16-49]